MFVFCGLQTTKIFGGTMQVLYICSYQVRDKRLVREASGLGREASQEADRKEPRSKKPLTEGPVDHGPALQGARKPGKEPERGTDRRTGPGKAGNKVTFFGE